MSTPLLTEGTQLAIILIIYLLLHEKNTKVNSVVEFVDVEFKTPKIFSQYYNNIRQRKTANSHICEAQNDLKVQCLLHYHQVKVRMIVLPLSYRRRLQHSNH